MLSKAYVFWPDANQDLHKGGLSWSEHHIRGYGCEAPSRRRPVGWGRVPDYQESWGRAIRSWRFLLFFLRNKLIFRYSPFEFCMDKEMAGFSPFNLPLIAPLLLGSAKTTTQNFSIKQKNRFYHGVFFLLCISQKRCKTQIVNDLIYEVIIFTGASPEGQFKIGERAGSNLGPALSLRRRPFLYISLVAKH